MHKIVCIAIPGKILEIDDYHMAKIDFDGIRQSVSLDMLPEAKINDYVLVHAGFAIEKVDETEAQKAIDLFKELSN